MRDRKCRSTFFSMARERGQSVLAAGIFAILVVLPVSTGAQEAPTEANTAPDADFVMVPKKAMVGDPVVVLSVTSDADSDPLTYTWFIDGKRYDSLDGLIEWQVSDAAIGEHMIRLVVEDGRGGRDEVSKPLLIVEEGDPHDLLLVAPEPFEESDLDDEWVDEDTSTEVTEPAPTPAVGGAASCSEQFSSLEETYRQYIGAYNDLSAAISTVEIVEPVQMREAQLAYFDANRRSETGDRRAFQERIAAINKLNSLASKTPITDPASLGEIQERFFQAKKCYEEILANK